MTGTELGFAKVANDPAENAHNNWRMKDLLRCDRQFALYDEYFEKPLKSLKQGSAMIRYIYTCF